MGQYDTVTCKWPLPWQGVTGWQTHSLGKQMLDYEIGPDGSLWQLTAYDNEGEPVDVRMPCAVNGPVVISTSGAEDKDKFRPFYSVTLWYRGGVLRDAIYFQDHVAVPGPLAPGVEAAAKAVRAMEILRKSQWGLAWWASSDFAGWEVFPPNDEGLASEVAVVRATEGFTDPVDAILAAEERAVATPITATEAYGQALGILHTAEAERAAVAGEEAKVGVQYGEAGVSGPVHDIIRAEIREAVREYFRKADEKGEAIDGTP